MPGAASATRFKLIFSIILCLLGAACGKIQNKTDLGVLTCGIPLSESEGNFLVKFLLDDETELSPDDIADLNASYSFDGKNFSPVPLSPKACMTVPSAGPKAFIRAYVADSSLFLTTELLPQDSRRYTVVKLRRAQKPDLRIECPGGKLFANNRLWNPLSESNWSDFSPLEVDLIARQIDNSQLSFPLYTMQRSSLVPRGMLDLGALPEGAYVLEARTRDLLFDAGKTERIQKFNEDCVLFVLRDPKFGTTRDEGTLTILRTSEGLPFKKNRDDDQLLSCMEPLSPSMVLTLEPCTLRQKCKDASSFIPDGASTQAPGLYLISALIEDRAGYLSDPACKTVAIVDQPPLFSPRWRRQEWNLPHAFLKFPEGSLDVSVEIDGSQPIPPQILAESLLCKAEFISKGTYTVRGDEVYCNSGLCQGKSLGDFIPCGDTFGVSLDKAWSLDYIQNSQLKITVKAGPELGIESEKTLYLGIATDRWRLRKTSPPGVDTEGLIAVVADDQKNLYALSGSQGLFEYSPARSSWTPAFVPAGLVQPNPISLTRRSDGQILSLWKDQNSYHVFSRSAEAWVASATFPLECLTVRLEDPSVTVCELFAGKFRLYRQGTQPLELNGANLPVAGTLEFRILGGRVFIAAKAGVLRVLDLSQSDAGDWMTPEGFVNEFNLDVLQILPDGDQFWVYLGGTTLEEFGLVTRQKDRWVYRKLDWNTGPWGAVLSRRALMRDSAGNIYVQGFLYDKAQQRLKRPEAVDKVFPVSPVIADQDALGNVWYRGSAAYFTEAWETGNYWPVEAFGLSGYLPLYYDRELQKFWFVGSDVNTRNRQIYEITKLDYVPIFEKTHGLPDAEYPNISFGVNGQPQATLFEQSQIYRFESGRWMPETAFPNISGENFQEGLLTFPSDHQLFFSRYGLYLKRKNQRDWIMVFDDKKFETLFCSEEELSGNACGGLAFEMGGETSSGLLVAKAFRNRVRAIMVLNPDNLDVNMLNDTDRERFSKAGHLLEDVRVLGDKIYALSVPPFSSEVDLLVFDTNLQALELQNIRLKSLFIESTPFASRGFSPNRGPLEERFGYSRQGLVLCSTRSISGSNGQTQDGKPTLDVAHLCGQLDPNVPSFTPFQLPDSEFYRLPPIDYRFRRNSLLPVSLPDGRTLFLSHDEVFTQKNGQWQKLLSRADKDATANSSSQINSYQVDPYGRLWVGFRSAGWYFFD